MQIVRRTCPTSPSKCVCVCCKAHFAKEGLRNKLVGFGKMYHLFLPETLGFENLPREEK